MARDVVVDDAGQSCGGGGGGDCLWSAEAGTLAAKVISERGVAPIQRLGLPCGGLVRSSKPVTAFTLCVSPSAVRRAVYRLRAEPQGEPPAGHLSVVENLQRMLARETRLANIHAPNKPSTAKHQVELNFGDEQGRFPF